MISLNTIRAAHDALKKRGEIRQPLLTREDEAKAKAHLIERARELLKTNHMNTVAKILDIGKATMSRWKREGLITCEYGVTNEEAMKRAVALFDSGVAIRPAAERCGVYNGTLRNRLIELGRDVSRKFSRVDPARIARGIQLYQQGMMISRAAKEVGLSTETLRYHMRMKP